MPNNLRTIVGFNITHKGFIADSILEQYGVVGAYCLPIKFGRFDIPSSFYAAASEANELAARRDLPCIDYMTGACQSDGVVSTMPWLSPVDSDGGC